MLLQVHNDDWRETRSLFEAIANMRELADAESLESELLAEAREGSMHGSEGAADGRPLVQLQPPAQPQ